MGSFTPPLGASLATASVPAHSGGFSSIGVILLWPMAGGEDDVIKGYLNTCENHEPLRLLNVRSGAHRLQFVHFFQKLVGLHGLQCAADGSNHPKACRLKFANPPLSLKLFQGAFCENPQFPQDFSELVQLQDMKSVAKHLKTCRCKLENPQPSPKSFYWAFGGLSKLTETDLISMGFPSVLSSCNKTVCVQVDMYQIEYRRRVQVDLISLDPKIRSQLRRNYTEIMVHRRIFLLKVDDDRSRQHKIFRLEFAEEKLELNTISPCESRKEESHRLNLNAFKIDNNSLKPLKSNREPQFNADRSQIRYLSSKCIISECCCSDSKPSDSQRLRRNNGWCRLFPLKTDCSKDNEGHGVQLETHSRVGPEAHIKHKILRFQVLIAKDSSEFKVETHSVLLFDRLVLLKQLNVCWVDLHEGQSQPGGSGSSDFSPGVQSSRTISQWYLVDDSRPQHLNQAKWSSDCSTHFNTSAPECDRRREEPTPPHRVHLEAHSERRQRAKNGSHRLKSDNLVFLTPTGQNNDMVTDLGLDSALKEDTGQIYRDLEKRGCYEEGQRAQMCLHSPSLDGLSLGRSVEEVTPVVAHVSRILIPLLGLLLAAVHGNLLHVRFSPMALLLLIVLLAILGVNEGLWRLQLGDSISGLLPLLPPQQFVPLSLWLALSETAKSPARITGGFSLASFYWAFSLLVVCPHNMHCVPYCPRMRKQPEQGGRLRFLFGSPRRRSGGVVYGGFRDYEGDFVSYDGYGFLVLCSNGDGIHGDSYDDGYDICDDGSLHDDGYGICDDGSLRDDGYGINDGYSVDSFYDDGYGIGYDICDDGSLHDDGYGICDDGSLRDDGYGINDGCSVDSFYDDGYVICDDGYGICRDSGGDGRSDCVFHDGYYVFGELSCYAVSGDSRHDDYGFPCGLSCDELAFFAVSGDARRDDYGFFETISKTSSEMICATLVLCVYLIRLPKHVGIYNLRAIAGHFKAYAMMCDALVLGGSPTRPWVGKVHEIDSSKTSSEMICDTVVLCVYLIRQRLSKLEDINFLAPCDCRDYRYRIGQPLGGLFSQPFNYGNWDSLFASYIYQEVCNKKLLEVLFSKPSDSGTWYSSCGVSHNYQAYKPSEVLHGHQISQWMEGDDVSESWNRSSGFAKTLYEVLLSHHPYPSCERSDTREMDVSAADSRNGREHSDCGFNYGVLDSFCDSCDHRGPGQSLAIPKCFKSHNMEFSWCDYPTRPRLEAYELLSSGDVTQSSHEGPCYYKGSDFSAFRICQRLEIYEADEMSYEDSCECQIVSSGDLRSSHEFPYYSEVSDFCDRETCRCLETYQVDGKSCDYSCDFRIHQRLRTHGVETSGCFYQSCQERPLYWALDPCDYRIPQRLEISDTDEICIRVATLKTDCDVLDQRNTWVLFSFGSQLRRFLETSKISETYTPKTDCNVLLDHPPQVSLCSLKPHKTYELCGPLVLETFEDYRTAFSGTYENECGGCLCPADSQVYRRSSEIFEDCESHKQPNLDTFQEKVCAKLDSSWTFGTLKLTLLWGSAKNDAICIETFGMGVFGRLVSCHCQIRERVLLEAHRIYLIFSAFASWSWAAFCLIVFLLVRPYASRTTTMDKLCLLLAVYRLVPQGVFCASEASSLIFPAVFFGGPQHGLVLIFSVYFIEGCGWLLGSRITASFDSRGCGMGNDDDTTGALLYASLWQEPPLLLPSIIFVYILCAVGLRNQMTTLWATMSVVALLGNAATSSLSSFSETLCFVSKKVQCPARATQFVLWWDMALSRASSFLKVLE
eukprot:scaffold1083_cov114-Cylindrotheca_fusiformis.AAC.12